MKLLFYVIIAIFLLRCRADSDVSKRDTVKLYNDALDQIIAEKYFYHCLDLDDKAAVANKDFLQAKIDSSAYLKILDSLKAARRKMLPKCVLDYATELQMFTKNGSLNDSFKLSIKRSLTDIFANDVFDGSVTNILDMLSQPVDLNVKDFSISYLEIIPYTKRRFRPFGEGMGVFSFSKAYFNESMNKAILFYEFQCGPKCGTGEIVVLERRSRKWKVVEYRKVWDS